MSTQNPEVFRAIKEDFHSQKLSITAIICVMISLLVCLNFGSSPATGLSLLPQSPERRIDLLLALYWIQFTVLALWASKEILDQTVSDKMDRAWDFIRMTSQSDRKLLTGRIAGPALFPLYVAACFFPATFLVFLATPLANLAQFVALYVVLANVVLFLWIFSFASVVRFNSARKPFAYILLVFFVFIILVASLNLKMEVFHIYPNYRYRGYMPSDDPNFLEQRFKAFWWAMFSLLLANAWLYLLSRWNLLLELSSRPKFWTTFALAWGPGIVGVLALSYPTARDQLAVTFYAPFVVFVFALAFIYDEGIEQYKKWLVIGRAQLNEAPLWIAGAAALVAATFIAPLFSHERLVGFPVTIFTITLLILRDLLIVQIVELFVSKHAKLLAIAVIIMLHACTDIIVPLMGSDGLAFFLSDFHTTTPSDQLFAVNAGKITLALCQTAVVGLIFVKKLRATLRL